MKNELVKSLMKANKVIKTWELNSDINSLKKVVKLLKNETKFIRKKFELNKIEALFLAAICLYKIENNNRLTEIDDITRILEINNLELLFQKEHIYSLEKKELIKLNLRNSNSDDTPEIEFLNLELNLSKKITKLF